MECSGGCRCCRLPLMQCGRNSLLIRTGRNRCAIYSSRAVGRGRVALPLVLLQAMNAAMHGARLGGSRRQCGLQTEARPSLLGVGILPSADPRPEPS